MKIGTIALLAVLLAGCHDLARKDSTSASMTSAVSSGPMQGVFDNHEQVWRAQDSGAPGIAAPHLVVAIEAAQTDWSIWRVHLDATPPLDALWAMHREGSGGTIVMTPHRALIAAPAIGSAFDAKQWAPLDACALRGSGDAAHARLASDIAACAAIAPGIGAQTALLPIAVEHEGEWLRVRLYADQARGADAREETRRVRQFSGWAAINGGGPKAAAESRDWHMDRGVVVGSEGGRYALKWRDGTASGYSLVLERLTYREGNVPVLKLSVVDDSGPGHTLAYAWANPEAMRIGINLGWVQVGLDASVEMTLRIAAARNRATPIE